MPLTTGKSRTRIKKKLTIAAAHAVLVPYLPIGVEVQTWSCSEFLESVHNFFSFYFRFYAFQFKLYLKIVKNE